MPVSARSAMAEREPPPRRAPAPVVPLRPARRPSPEVVRRRRVLAVCGLLAGVVLVALVLGAVAGPSAHDRIARLLRTGTAAPTTLCDHLSTGMAQAVGGRAGCLSASPQRGPEGTVRQIRVTGATASAVVTDAGGVERYRLVRQRGDWKVDDVR